MEEKTGTGAQVVVSLHGVTKYFGKIQALDHVDLKVRKGEVLALLGARGAGVSTLLRLLCGLERPDNGRMEAGGKPRRSFTPEYAAWKGIALAYAEGMWMPRMTLLENLLLDCGSGIENQFSKSGLLRKLVAMEAEFQFGIEPETPVAEADMGQRVRCGLLRALALHAEVLLLDAPTAAMTPQQAGALWKQLRDLAKRGFTVVIACYEPQDAARADRCVVLRDGVVVGEVADASEEELELLLRGEEETPGEKRRRIEPRGTFLEIRNFRVTGARGRAAVQDVSLRARRGEILGIAGTDRSGVRELLEAITGWRRVASGQMFLGEHDLTGALPGELWAYGMATMPPLHEEKGIIDTLSMAENSILEKRRQRRFSPNGLISPSAMYLYAREQMRTSGIAPVEPDLPAGEFSSGDRQKAVLARILATDPDVLVAISPTKGVEQAARDDIHRVLIAQRTMGRSLLLFSEDIQELIQVSDRITVLYEGGVLGELDARLADPYTLGLMMTGGQNYA